MKEADSCDLRTMSVRLVNFCLDELAHSGVFRQRSEMRESDSTRLSPFGHCFEINLDECGDESAAVCDDDALLDIGASLNRVLNLGRSQVFTAGGDHDVLQARSEERRVGKEWRSRQAPGQARQKRPGTLSRA